jgi:hypothetical protein
VPAGFDGEGDGHAGVEGEEYAFFKGGEKAGGGQRGWREQGFQGVVGIGSRLAGRGSGDDYGAGIEYDRACSPIRGRVSWRWKVRGKGDRQ